jgi:gluconate 5-dehydrogenase
MNVLVPNAFALSGHVVLLTGAARGLGFEMARLLAHAGAHVVINGRDSRRAEEAAARLLAEGGRGFFRGFRRNRC